VYDAAYRRGNHLQQRDSDRRASRLSSVHLPDETCWVLDLGGGFDRGTALSLGLERKPQVGFGSWQILLDVPRGARNAMSLKTAFRAIVWAASIDSMSDRPVRSLASDGDFG
jgi:hypothetical protein